MNSDLDAVSEDLIENTPLRRLVNRNDQAVLATLVNGRVAYARDGGFAKDLGVAHHYGKFLPARTQPA